MLTIFRTDSTVLAMKSPSNYASKGAEAARQELPAILAAAADGRTTMITRHGRQIAAVVPVSALKIAKPVSLLTLAGSGAGLWGKHSSLVIADLRDEWSR
jgi:antitoxin (DNA-binding transcriptional repressor) of toxin-antitoxin stability system